MIPKAARPSSSPCPRSRARAGSRSAAWTSTPPACCCSPPTASRSEEHTSELQSLMRISYAVFCLTKKKDNIDCPHYQENNRRIHKYQITTETTDTTSTKH